MLPSWWLLVKLDARHIPCVCPLLISLPVTFILLTGNDWNGTLKSVLGHRKYVRMVWNTYADLDFWCKVCLTNTNTEPKSNTVYHNHTFEVHSLGFGCAYHTCFTRTDGPSNSSWVYLQKRFWSVSVDMTSLTHFWNACRFHLSQEHSELINVHDWYQSFSSICCPINLSAKKKGGKRGKPEPSMDPATLQYPLSTRYEFDAFEWNLLIRYGNVNIDARSW